MLRIVRGRAWVTAGLLAIGGCGSLEGNIGLGILGATVAGGKSVSSDLEQTYYLGVFDPQDQLPPEVYRIRVRGQASFISPAKFASGWVHASVVDSLQTSAKFDAGGNLALSGTSGDSAKDMISTGRRLMMFGPEGFREAPKDHRLVVVMGSDPSGFFQGIDTALGDIADVRFRTRNNDLNKQLFEALATLRVEERQLADLKAQIDSDFK